MSEQEIRLTAMVHIAPERVDSPHTPGPWGGEGVCVFGPTNQMRPDTQEDGTVVLHPSELIALVYACGASLEANRQLIAAAPTLLATLQRILQISYDAEEQLGERLEAIRDNARMAIQRAGGRQ